MHSVPQSINGAAAAAAWRAGGDEWGFGGCTARLRATAERGQRVGNRTKARNKKSKGRNGEKGRKAQTAPCKVGTSVGLEGVAWRERFWQALVSLISDRPIT